MSETNSKRFMIGQIILLSVTLLGIFFFAIPLFSVVKDALNKTELLANLDRSDSQFRALNTQIAQLQASKVMSGSDPATQDNLNKQLVGSEKELASVKSENEELRKRLAKVEELLNTVGKTNENRAVQGETKPQSSAVAEKKDDSKLITKSETEEPGLIKSVTQSLDTMITIGDKISSLFTKLTGTLVSLITGIGFAIRWVKSGFKVDPKIEKPAA